MSLTRAKHHLILVGRAQTLQQSPLFKTMLTLARKTPAGYAPNIQVASTNLAKLALNPKLFEHSATGEDASDDSHGPAALALRSVARDYQLSAADTGHHKRRASGSASSSRFAPSSPSRDEHGPDEDEDDDFDLDEPAGDAAAVADADAEAEEEEEEVDLTNIAGMSPYARQQLDEQISSRSTGERQHGSADAHREGGDAESVSLRDLLSKKRAREVEERIQRDSKRPARQSEAAAAAAANATDSDEGEFDMLDEQAHAPAPHSASETHLTALSPRPLSSIREALSRSSSSSAPDADDTHMHD